MESFLTNLTNGQISNQQYTGKLTSGNNVSSVSLLDMKPGDMFQGEIVSVNGEEVQLKLAANQYLAARLEGQVQLALGQLLTFQVQSNKDSHIVLKPVYTNLLQQQVGQAALKAANLPANEKNLQLVSNLLENGMPIDKASLVNTYRQVLLHPNANVNNILNLIKLDIPVTDNNIIQYECYKNMEHKLLGAIYDTVNDIFTTYDEIDSQSAPKFMEKILSFLETNDNVLNQDIDITVKEEAFSTKETNLGDIAGNDSTLIQNDSIDKNIKSDTHVDDDTSAAQSGNSLNIKTDEKEKEMLPMDKESALKQILSQTNSDNPNQNRVGINSILNLISNLPDQERHILFKDDKFREIVRNKLIEQWTLTPDEVKKPEKIQDFYKKIYEDSSKLARIMEEATNNETSIHGQSAKNLHDNVDFMNQMNHVFTYVQLPLKLSNSKAQGELYVYTNKKNLARKEGALTALLHLDMEHLGKMDVNISLQPENNMVTNRFFLQEEIIPFLEKHMDELSNRLETLGYRTKTVVSRFEDEKRVVDIMEEQVSGRISPLSYQAFDMRT